MDRRQGRRVLRLRQLPEAVGWHALTNGKGVVGAPERIDRLAAFIVEHWDKRRAAMEGKAMVVTMSRDIAARPRLAVRADDASGAGRFLHRFKKLHQRRQYEEHARHVHAAGDDGGGPRPRESHRRLRAS